MKRILQMRRGVGGLIVVMIFFFLFLLGAPAFTCAGDGIGQPGDGLNSTSPSPNGETIAPLESLLLSVSLSMLV